METVPEHHKVRVVKVGELLTHPNADKLLIVKVLGYQVVVGKDDFKVGDLGYYIPPDSIVPPREEFQFLWKDRLPPLNPDEEIPVKYRRITVRKFRKAWSEGLLMPLCKTYLAGTTIQNGWGIRDADGIFHFVDEGQDITEIIGVEHYNPPEPGEVFQTRKEQYKRWPRSLKGWYYFILRKLGFDLNYPMGGENERGPKDPPPIYDVENFKHYPNAFDPDLDTVIVTEKIHGSNIRLTFRDGKFYVGSRKLWKSFSSRSIWRHAVEQDPRLEVWCREHPGYTLYGEVVPTQSFKNGKVASYGADANHPRVFIYDVLDPDGKWHLPTEFNIQFFMGSLGFGAIELFTTVPVLRYGTFHLPDMLLLVDGPSQVEGADHIREGIVIRQIHDRHVTGLGRLHLKIVSNEYLANVE